MINLTLLNTFCTLAEIGHFTLTAERLFMTQSGVSQHIKKLEQHLDTELLIREGKSFRLTKAGQALLVSGTKLLQDTIELEQSFKEDNQYAGKISVMSPGSLGLKLYPEFLSLQKRYMALSFDYVFAPNTSIESALQNHALDFGLMTQRPQFDSIMSEVVGQESIVLVTPASMGANHHAMPTWQQLMELGFINHPDAQHHAQLLLAANYSEFEHIDQFKSKGSSNQISLLLEPVALGLGFTVIPLFAAQAFNKQEAIAIYQCDVPVSESIYLCRHRRALPLNRLAFVETELKRVLKSG